jgi:hypothetical protein
VQLATLAHLAKGLGCPLLLAVEMEKSVIDLVGILCNVNQALKILKLLVKVM